MVENGLRQRTLVFKGMSKEMMSRKLQILQFNLSGSFKRAYDLKSELTESREHVKAKEYALVSEYNITHTTRDGPKIQSLDKIMNFLSSPSEVCCLNFGSRNVILWP